MRPAIGRISNIFEALKTFFSDVEGQTFIKSFFNDPLAKFWLLKIESDSISVVDVSFHMEELRANIVSRQQEGYFGPKLESEKKILIENNEYGESKVNGIIDKFYGSYIFLFTFNSNSIINKFSYDLIEPSVFVFQ